MLTLLALVSASLLIDRLLERPGQPLPRVRATGALLDEARSALIGFALSHPNAPGRLPYPDRNADAAGYDGVSDCNNTPFDPGTGLGGPANPPLRLGRLPWRGALDTLSGCLDAAFTQWRLEATSPLRNFDGLWYAVSGNLLHNSGQRLNWSLVDGNPAFPWLKVRAANGSVLSDRVAFVVIAPGRALRRADGTWQIRDEENDPAPDPDEFLDRIDIGGGVYSNADADGCPDDDVACLVLPA